MREREFDSLHPELMDREQPVSPELKSDLENLAAINRHFGGQRIWRFFLTRWLRPGGRYRLLDLATGGGDGPRLMVEFARRIGATVAITAIDFQPSTLALARRWSVAYPEIEFREGDARAADLSGDEPYDFAFCSLALHHFSEPDAVVVLRQLGQWGQRGSMAADLSRGLVCSAGAWLVTSTLYREAMTKHDARMSARRAFSFAELGRMATAATWRNFGQRRFRFGRQAIWRESTDAI